MPACIQIWLNSTLALHDVGANQIFSFIAAFLV